MKLRNKKTGEIIEIDKINFVFNDGYAPFSSLRILNAYWEDYTQKEPLIKDEKIRKAIKVWARLNDVKEVMFDEYWHCFRDVDMVISFLFTFRDFDCLEDGKTYTIAELCGEEEE